MKEVHLGEAFGRPRSLRHRADFDRVRDARVRVHSYSFSVSLAANPLSGDALVRLGLVVTRKVGNAVVRNRWKRLTREVVRKHASWFLPGVDIVVFVKPGAAPGTFGEVEREWSKLVPNLLRRCQEALAKKA